MCWPCECIHTWYQTLPLDASGRSIWLHLAPVEFDLQKIARRWHPAFEKHSTYHTCYYTGLWKNAFWTILLQAAPACTTRFLSSFKFKRLNKLNASLFKWCLHISTDFIFFSGQYSAVSFFNQQNGFSQFKTGFTTWMYTSFQHFKTGF